MACRCGDIVVTDTKLTADDPVVTRSCPIDGLIVRASSLAEGIVLDLNGFTLKGSGTGTGILVEAGGTDGALVVGGTPGTRGNVVGFASGVTALHPGTLRRLERVVVRASRRDGITLRTRGTLVVEVESSDNVGNGVRLTGEGGRLIDVLAERNGESGIYVAGRSSSVSGRVTDNKKHGVVADGHEIDLHDIVSRGNGGRGVILRAARSMARNVVSEANLLADVLPKTGGGS